MATRRGPVQPAVLGAEHSNFERIAGRRDRLREELAGRAAHGQRPALALLGWSGDHLASAALFWPGNCCHGQPSRRDVDAVRALGGG